MRAEGSGQRTLPEQLGKQTISCYEAAVTLARLTEVLAPAAASGVGLGAFNVPGMTKINIATHLNHVFTDAVREVLAANPAMVDSRRYLGPAREAVAVEAARLLRMFRDL